MAKILICGGEGQLAREFVEYFKENNPDFDVSSFSHSELDVTSEENVAAIFSKIKPEIVINTAAYHKVDECESNIWQTFLTNSYGGYLVAKTARDIGARSMFFSTGYIFDGEKDEAYIESDEPSAISIYGHSKALAEKLILTCDPQAFVIRTNGVFGMQSSKTKGGRGNFIDFVYGRATAGENVDMVSDQQLTPTATEDLVMACTTLFLEKEGGGIWHITNSGYADWFKVAQKVYDIANSKGKVNPISSEERAVAAKRPKNSLLENARWKESGREPLPHWEKAVEKYISIKYGN